MCNFFDCALLLKKSPKLAKFPDEIGTYNSLLKRICVRFLVKTQQINCILKSSSSYSFTNLETTNVQIFS